MAARKRRRLGQEVLDAITDDIRAVTEKISTVESVPSNKARERVRRELTVLVTDLRHAVNRLDPVLRPQSLFNPLDPGTTARIVALMAAAQPRHPLAGLKAFYGAGVYALYYRGPFEAYEALSGKEHPIYVGKADPLDPETNDPVEHGKALYGRLQEHAASINRTPTLSIADFDCRFLITQSGFQHAAEAQLINFFKPIWNKETRVCYGIGKHGDAAETRRNKRSPWDTLHPGRSWADESEDDQRSRDEIIANINKHLETYPPKSTVAELLDGFIAELRQIEPAKFEDADGEPQGIDLTDVEISASDEVITEETLF